MGASSSKATIISVAVGSVLSLVILLGYYIRKRRIEAKKESAFSLKPPEIFTVEQLINATDNFSAKKRIGGGKFGSVYKGELSDGSVVAIRDLSGTDEEAGGHMRLSTAGEHDKLNTRPSGIWHQDGSKLKKDIMGKLARLNALKHKNLVELKGCCVEEGPKSGFNKQIDGSKLFLVYEYMGGGSLDSRLNDLHIPLDWHTRYKIMNDVANGLAYMHAATSIGAIAHRGIKTSNILMMSEDQAKNPHAKIADVGLHSLASQWTISKNNTEVKDPRSDDGTKGQKFKDDVINFGFLALEMVFGSQEKHQLREMARQVLKEGKWLNIVDPRLQEELTNEEVKTEVETILVLALRCISETYPVPSMREVDTWLKGKSCKPSSLFGKLVQRRVL